jgi:acyl carrier protein
MVYGGEITMTFEEFKKVISDITRIPVDRIEKESSFRDDLDIDSLRMVNLIVVMVENYGFEIGKISNTENLKTVGSFYQTLLKVEK